MRRLAEYATRNRGRVLEIGFGLGISASEIMSLGCDEYVVIEAHPEVAERARQWGRAQATPVSVVEDFWQNALDRVGRFDGILFDTYPVNNSPSSNNYFGFLPEAHRLLRPGGGVTYFSGDTRKIPAEHIALVFEHFNEVEFSVVENLRPPKTCRYWRHDHMVAPYLRSPRHAPPKQSLMTSPTEVAVRWRGGVWPPKVRGDAHPPMRCGTAREILLRANDWG